MTIYEAASDLKNKFNNGYFRNSFWSTRNKQDERFSFFKHLANQKREKVYLGVDNTILFFANLTISLISS